MHDSRFMDQVNSAQDIVYDGYDMLFSKLHFVRHIQYLCHILIFVFHDQKHIFEVIVGQNIQQFDRKYVFRYLGQPPHYRYFTYESPTQ